mgnify:CR=1 FL=1
MKQLRADALTELDLSGQHIGPTGCIVLAKLDGTARGGIVVPIRQQMDLPVKYVGVGEGIEDLEPFDANWFVEALFAEDS